MTRLRFRDLRYKALGRLCVLAAKGIRLSIEAAREAEDLALDAQQLGADAYDLAMRWAYNWHPEYVDVCNEGVFLRAAEDPSQVVKVCAFERPALDREDLH